MSSSRTPETAEQLLIRRVFKQISNNHFKDHKMIPHYCGPVHFDRTLGEDIAEYMEKHNPEYYEKKRLESEEEPKPFNPSEWSVDVETQPRVLTSVDMELELTEVVGERTDGDT